MKSIPKVTLQNNTENVLHQKIDKNPENACTFDLLILKKPKFFVEEPECIQVDLQMLLDSCEDCKHFADISKKAYKLRNVLPCAY